MFNRDRPSMKTSPCTKGPTLWEVCMGKVVRERGPCLIVVSDNFLSQMMIRIDWEKQSYPFKAEQPKTSASFTLS